MFILKILFLPGKSLATVPTIILSQSCRTRFKKAGERVKEAFDNDFSSTEEKIKASKIRIASAILEHLAQCGLATRDFKLCLQDFSSSIVAGEKPNLTTTWGLNP